MKFGMRNYKYLIIYTSKFEWIEMKFCMRNYKYLIIYTSKFECISFSILGSMTLQGLPSDVIEFIISIYTMENGFNFKGVGGGTGDFEVKRHVSKQIAIAQKLYIREWQKYTFSEGSLSALSEKSKMGSIGIPNKILASPLGKVCCDGVVFT